MSPPPEPKSWLRRWFKRRCIENFKLDHQMAREDIVSTSSTHVLHQEIRARVRLNSQLIEQYDAALVWIFTKGGGSTLSQRFGHYFNRYWRLLKARNGLEWVRALSPVNLEISDKKSDKTCRVLAEASHVVDHGAKHEYVNVSSTIPILQYHVKLIGVIKITELRKIQLVWGCLSIVCILSTYATMSLYSMHSFDLSIVCILSTYAVSL